MVMPLTSYLSASLSLLPCFPFESFHGQAESLEVVLAGAGGVGGTLSPPSPQIAVVLIKGTFLSIYDNKNRKKTLVSPTAPRIRAQGGWGVQKPHEWKGISLQELLQRMTIHEVAHSSGSFSHRPGGQRSKIGVSAGLRSFQGL